MILDKQGEFCSAQAVTAAAASDNYIDMGVAKDRLGSGRPLKVVMTCTTAMTDASSDSTLAVALQQDDNTSFTSATSLATMATFPATSAIGTQYVYTIPDNLITERYVRVYFTPANGNLSTGSFTVGLVADFQSANANKP